MISPDTWSDALDADSDPLSYWSTTNVGEAMPGVPTPLCWSIWGPAADGATRGAFAAVGALERSRAALPSDDRQRAVSIFSGRVAARVDFLGEMGDRLPGTTGRAVVEQYLGTVPPGMEFHRVRSRYPVIATRFPVEFATIHRRLHAERRRVIPWWTTEIARSPHLNLDQARDQFAVASRRFIDIVLLQSKGMFIGVQPMYDAVLKLIQRYDMGHLFGALMGGGGDHAETEIVSDLWRLGREQITLATFLTRHGYHGPNEGELSATVWRENHEPVLRIAAQYRDRDDELDPELTARKRTTERNEAERTLLAAIPAPKRPAARALLALAQRNVPLRGVGKSSFLRAFDVSRAAARRVGHLLAEDGVIAHADDVFFLTARELTGALPRDVRTVVADRREDHAELELRQVPTTWRGKPPVTLVEADASTGEDADDVVTGLPVSAGIVEGVARVVTDPTFADVEPDDILVAPTTDPSWASILFLCKALVVDIGGHLSHAAIVSRELGIPCVVDTRDGTRRVRTGDHLRVDGSTGRVEIVKRADT